MIYFNMGVDVEANSMNFETIDFAVLGFIVAAAIVAFVLIMKRFK